MSKDTNTNDVYDGLVLDADRLSTGGINAVRISFGLLGIIGIGLGIVLLVWPAATLVVVAGILAVLFLVSGIARVAFGIFGRDMAGSARTLNLILGLLLVVGSIVVLKNLEASTEVLFTIIIIFVGIGWIIEGVITLATAKRAESKGIAWVGGIIGILAGIVVIAAPQWSVLAFVIFTGIMILALGIVAVVRALTFGKNAKTSKVIDA